MKNVGLISPKILSVHVFGYVAVVKTLEVIGVGNSLRVAKKKPGKSLSPNRVSILILCPWPLYTGVILVCNGMLSEFV